jgi:hypothetical protein
MLTNFLSKVQNKHWENLQRRTQKLEITEKADLLEYLEDNLDATASETNKSPGNINNEMAGNDSADGEDESDDDDDDDDEYAEEDYELLQRDLDKANARLEELQSKHDFLQTRLHTYRTKISAAEESLRAAAAGSATKPPLPPEKIEAMTAKIEAYKESLLPVEATYQSIASELNKHQQNIESMQDRQTELKLKTQECRVVLRELTYGRDLGLSFSDEGGEILAQIERHGNKSIHHQTDPTAIAFRDEEGSGNEDVEAAVVANKVDENGGDGDDDNKVETEDELPQQQQANETDGDETAKEQKGLLAVPAVTQGEAA